MCGVFLNLCYGVIEKLIQEKVHSKSLLKYCLESFKLHFIHIYTIQVPTFYLLLNSTKHALKHLFGVKEAGIRSKVCNLLLQTLVRDYVILTLICLIFQCALKRSKLLNLEKIFLDDSSLYQELLIMIKMCLYNSG